MRDEQTEATLERKQSLSTEMHNGFFFFFTSLLLNDSVNHTQFSFEF